MKELYLAMDRDLRVWGFTKKPTYDRESGEWVVRAGVNVLFSPEMLQAHDISIDVTKFPISHETPIKIRAVWECVE